MARMPPRQSLYGNPAASVHQLNSIHACIESVRASCDIVAETNQILAHHTGDFDRLRTAMASQRHFDLVSERDVRQARDHVAAEIAPLLRELIVRAEDALTNDERHARTLRNQATQELAQLEARSGAQGVLGDSSRSSPSVAALVTQTEIEEQRRTLEKLRTERKRLAEKVAALEQRQSSAA
ncbi:DASH complex subunit spc19 [Malassezia furfur]|uniref:DASH complex subunit SPC19 n=1 Tax=Malassezia furfur TaxID=55194 RepID=A0ABY8EJH0_MALFU|nr:DASH complex subunit spc19 [Malassezia furfur]